MRIGGSIGEKIAPNPDRFVAISILFGGDAEIVPGADYAVVQSHGTLEGIVRFIGYHAVGFAKQGLAKIGLALCTFAKRDNAVRQAFAESRIASELHINRRQDFPAAAILGIDLKMSLDF